MKGSNWYGTLFTSMVAMMMMMVLPAWCEYYTMVNPNVRNGCTPRCSDLTSPGQWRCSDVMDSTGTPLNVCNTFELEDPHTCHYHHYNQTEVGQCLALKAADIVYVGMSNMFGMMASIFTYFNRADYDELNPYVWLDDETNDNHRVFGCYLNDNFTFSTLTEIHLDASGLLKWRGGCAGAGCTMVDVFDFAANKSISPGGSKMTFIRAKNRAEMLAGLDGLYYAGRQKANGWLVVNTGSYFGNVDRYRLAIVDFIEKVKLELPNYKVILVGYTFLNKLDINDVMQEVVATYGNRTDYPSMWYLDTLAMMSATNHPPYTVDHWIPVFNHVLFQRVLSVICVDMAGSECEEQMVGSSNTQFIPSKTWYSQLLRQGNLMTYTNNTGPFPSPPPAAGLSAEALPVLKCDDLDGDGYSVCGGDCNDANAAIRPCAPEICDGVDNSCLGTTDISCIPTQQSCFTNDQGGSQSGAGSTHRGQGGWPERTLAAAICLVTLVTFVSFT